MRTKVMDNFFSTLRAENFSRYSWLCDPIFAQWIIQMVKPYGDSVLDVGCGNGFMLQYYYHTFSNVAAIEPSTSLYGIARDKNPKVHICQGTAESIPFEDKSFDIVISKSSLHHFSDFEKGVQEMKRIAKKALVVIEVVTPTDNCKPFLEELLMTKEKGRKKQSVFSKDTVKELLQKSVGEKSVLQLFFDQYIDVKTWLEYSDLTSEMKKLMQQFIVSSCDAIKTDMQIHYRDGCLVMLRRMCLSIVLLDEK